MAKNEDDLPPCDRKIFRKGEHIATLDAEPEAAERWVKAIAQRANARVDWHYFGGRACVKFLGNAKSRSRVFQAIEELADFLDGRILRSFGPSDPPPKSFLPVSSFNK
ncbi:MAG: hypothetical protein AAB652_00030 [Patescibacteria group bacterium]